MCRGQAKSASIPQPHTSIANIERIPERGVRGIARIGDSHMRRTRCDAVVLQPTLAQHADTPDAPKIQPSRDLS